MNQQLNEEFPLSVENLLGEIKAKIFKEPAYALECAVRLESSARLSEDSFLLAQALYYRGSALELLRNLAESVPLLEESARLFEELGKFEQYFDVLYLLCAIAMQSEEYAHSLAIADKILPYFEEHHNTVKLAQTLNTIGTVHGRIGNLTTALSVHLRALALCSHPAYPTIAQSILANIGNVYAMMGDFEKAVEYHLQSLETASGAEHPYAEATAFSNLGASYAHLDNFEKAEEYWRRSSEAFQQMGMSVHMAGQYCNLGKLYFARGFPEKALEFSFQALDIINAPNAKNTEIECFCLETVAEVFNGQGDTEKAIEYLQKALNTASAIPSPRLEHLLHKNLSAIFEKVGDVARSFFHFKQFSLIKERMLGEEKQKSLMEMQVRFDVERLQKQTEIERLRNGELAEALAKVKKLNAELEIVNQSLVELNEEKNTFLGIVAHDLKNPLSNIKMLSNILEKEAEFLSLEEVQEFSLDIYSTSERMFDLITNLLDVNAIDSGKINLFASPFNLTELVGYIIQDYQARASKKQIEIHFSSDVKPVFCFADRNAVLQALDNFISNAVKYSPPEKRVFVAVTFSQ